MLAAQLCRDILSGSRPRRIRRKGERAGAGDAEEGARGRNFRPTPTEGRVRPDDPAEVVVLDKLPVLGTGKIDNGRRREAVTERARRCCERAGGGVNSEP